jgi:2,5-dichloro-2,5-cyclohexadiene-1,4-diol dehydrogenase 1
MLLGKSIIVTGAGSGIGRAAAIHFARDGAKVVIADWNEAAGLDTVAEISKAGDQAVFIRTDVTREADVETMVACAIENFGALDGAFNNAGIEMSNQLITELDIKSWQRVIDVDLTGVFLCMKHELRAMKGRAGSIVNMASGNGEIAQAFSSDYVSAKHGVVGLTRAASTEFPFTGSRNG